MTEVMDKTAFKTIGLAIFDKLKLTDGLGDELRCLEIESPQRYERLAMEFGQLAWETGHMTIARCPTCGKSSVRWPNDNTHSTIDEMKVLDNGYLNPHYGWKF